MTDGILLAELHRDRELSAYDTLIIDEAHERSLNIDFILGYLKQLLPRRPDLKVVITSATIDPQRFAAHFADAAGEPAPIVEVSGRTYPVEVRYRPLVEERYDDEDGEPVVRDQTEAVVAACQELAARGAGGRPGLPAGRAGDPRHRRRAGRGDLGRGVRSGGACRSSPGSPAPSSTGSSPPTPGAASCWPPTSPRPR